jgi:outer membrane murein-binding lipoprotein Lpp
MNWPSDASNWMDVFDHAIVVLGAIVLAGVPSWLAARNHSKIKGISEQVTGVAAQVTNGHTTPMRQDVDGIRAVVDEIRGDLHSMKSDVSDIRSELRQERKDRIDLDDRFERYKRDQ